jgi:hypothetical protein
MPSETAELAKRPIIPYDEGDRLTEAELAAKIKRTQRALRDRRKKGTASPYTHDGKTIIYSWQKYLEHLERNERRPVRSRK